MLKEGRSGLGAVIRFLHYDMDVMGLKYESTLLLRG